MDRAEAIEVIKELLADRDNDPRYPCVSSPRHYEALDLAIEALQEPKVSEDCISRQAVVEAVREKLQDWGSYAIEDYRRGLYEAQDLVSALPPVTPTERTGEWLPIIEATEMGEPYTAGIYCSECGEKLGCEANYCPDCGAKMKGEK